MPKPKGLAKTLNNNTRKISSQEFVRFVEVREELHEPKKASQVQNNQIVTKPLLEVRGFVGESVRGKRKRKRDAYPFIVWKSSV